MGTPLYYTVLGALLAVLVIALVLLIRKRRKEDEAIRAYQERMDMLRAERQAEEEKKKTYYTTYNEDEKQVTKWRHGRQYIDDDRDIPKYAAGDEMDCLRPRRQQSEFPESILIALIALVIAGGIAMLRPTGTTAQPKPAEKLNVEIVSAELNQSKTSVYVTLRFDNQAAQSCYNIVSTVTLSCGNQTADTKIFTLGVLPAATQQEGNLTLKIPEQYRNQAYSVDVKSQYVWKTT